MTRPEDTDEGKTMTTYDEIVARVLAAVAMGDHLLARLQAAGLRFEVR